MSIAMAAAAEAPTQGDRTTGLTDQDLVAAVRRGDDRAFEQLYSRYQRRIAAYIYGMVNDYAKAEDITQEVFISALRRMRETERPIAFKPWVYEIAKNACIDQFRRSRRAEEVSYDAEEGLGAADYGRLVTTGPSLDAAVDTKQQLDHLCGAFGGLSETHHQILVLRELEGLSYREIGEKMGLSRPSVESTLFRARKRLTEEYDELVSGQRCIRIQSIIESATEGDLGARDTRRLARHVSHCQPCRRQALSAGIDTGTIERRRPIGDKLARVAALFPVPMFMRRDKDSDAMAALSANSSQLLAQMPALAMTEPVVAGWGKAAAAAAALIIASAGAGAVTSGSGPLDVPAPSVSKARLGQAVLPAGSRGSDVARSHQNVAPTQVTRGATSTPSKPAAEQSGGGKRLSGSGGGSTPVDIPGPPMDNDGIPNEFRDGVKPPPEVGDPDKSVVPGVKDIASRDGVNVPTGGSEAGPGIVQEVEDQATAVNGDAGKAVGQIREAIGG